MMNRVYRVAFMGSDEIALPFLEYLHNECAFVEIALVLTQPDRRSGRGRKISQNAIKQWSLRHSIPCKSPEKPTDIECSWIREEKIDCNLVMAYGHILKKIFFDVSPGGCFNLHASLLPKYRGASPIETAIAMGDTVSGVTLMRVVQKMDAGPIVDSESVKIDTLDTGTTLRDRIAQSCVPLIQRNIEALVTGSTQETVQEEINSTYCRKLSKEDGNLNFSVPAKLLLNRVRAFQFWPGCGFSLQGQKFRIGLAEEKKNDLLLKVGETARDGDGNFLIGTGEGALRVLKLQKPGGKMLNFTDFLRGFNFPFGEIIESLEMKDLISSHKDIQLSKRFLASNG